METALVPSAPQYPAQVTGADLFPEDQYEDVPKLDDKAKTHIATGQQPFMVQAVMLRFSDKFADQSGSEKPFWFVVLTLSGSQFVTNFSAFLARYGENGEPIFEGYDRWARIAHALRHGAQQAGPFTLEAVDTGKGNAFHKVKAYHPTTTVKEQKRSA